MYQVYTDRYGWVVYVEEHDHITPSHVIWQQNQLLRYNRYGGIYFPGQERPKFFGLHQLEQMAKEKNPPQLVEDEKY